MNIHNVYCNKSVGRGVELAKPDIKYKNYNVNFANNYLPLNYTQYAENIHNLFEEEYDYNECINIISLKKDSDRRDILKSILDSTDYNNYRFIEAIEHNLGWIGCGLSHIKVIEQAIEEDKDIVIVAEDDFLPVCNKIKNSINKAIRILKENDNLDCFNGYPYGEWNNNIKKRIEDNAYEVGGGILTHFIIYHKRAFKKLLKLKEYYLLNQELVKNNLHKQHLAIDEFMNKHLNQFTLYPFLFYQFSQYSNTDKSEKVDKLAPENMFIHTLNFNDKMNKLRKFKFDENSDLTVVCFSCGRINELITTLTSFYETNTYDINNLIIIDDSHNKKIDEINEYFEEVNLIRKSENGHINNLKLGFYLAEQLGSKYIFQIEEDWKFTNPYYIEQSIKILENDEDIINVWLRDLNDTNKHPINSYKNIGNMNTYKLETNYEWKGFTFNPSVKRLSDFSDELFDAVNKNNKFHYSMEKKLDTIFYNNGYYSCILPFGCVYHTGYITSIPKWLNLEHD